MMHACTRALRFCALLALPASAFAQSTRSATVFSPSSQLGTVNVRAAVVLADYTVKPLPLLEVVARRTDRPDSVSGTTDLDGRVSMSLGAGAYTLRAKASQPVGGRSYAWRVSVVVRPRRTESVQLTNSNALSSDSVNSVRAAPVVAAAPPPAKLPVATPAAPPQANPFSVPATPPPNATPPRVVKLEAVASKPPRVNTTGLLLGLSLTGSGIRSDDLNSTTESGAGLAAQLGWGFTKNFALVFDLSAAAISTDGGDFGLGHAEIGGRWHFVSPTRALVPFLEVGYAGRAIVQEDMFYYDDFGNSYSGDFTLSGTGVAFGGGLQYHLCGHRESRRE